VNEASRLLSSAMQTAAIDPRTGRVDMDLIHTGRSAAQRTHVHELAAELKRFLSSRAVIRFQQLQAIDAAAVVDRSDGRRFARRTAHADATRSL
jgi:DNA replicative helicase MCM subunit Mcm2 (Cdc46/Mcm family)